MRVLVLVDGEHYPPVTRWGIETARSKGYEVVAALFLGGTEKVDPTALPDLGLPTLPAGADITAALADALDGVRPDAVLDLSDEPVVGYRERMELAAVSLVRGIPYLGPDFRLDPPISGPPLRCPTVAVIGTGKRTGKTAIGGEVARVAKAMGRNPVVVAMGRGGPPEPQVAQAGTVTLDGLLDLVRRGEHAASDYLEDAVTSGVTTIGARRAGGGLAGAPFASNVREAAELAVDLGAGLVVLEGSGSAVPPVPWDAGILAVPASAPPEYLGGYLGPFRLLLSDLVVLTMTGSPITGPENLLALTSHVQRIRGDARVVVTDLQPVPLGDVRGKEAFFTTTAPQAVASKQAASLEAGFGCTVVGWSARLADRSGLMEDLEKAEAYEVLLTELKAAAVDVACERAMSRGAAVVFVDNRPLAVDGGTDLPNLLAETMDLAVKRHEAR
ncbi:MAG TPA: 2,3-diphosphoglycerate synthetase [Actinomycetota bacterium]|nr:2,3-diphosphoglycerate synthetase [Actinomycetota bacterium]